MTPHLLTYVSQDVEFVRQMAAAQDGTPSDGDVAEKGSPFVMVDLPKPPLPAYGKDDLIRSYLANNRCVLVRGQTLEGPTAFTGDEIQAYKGSLAQSVEWQGV
jgi:hypothetical protein